jgi:hypothetical protein
LFVAEADVLPLTVEAMVRCAAYLHVRVPQATGDQEDIESLLAYARNLLRYQEQHRQIARGTWLGEVEDAWLDKTIWDLRVLTVSEANSLIEAKGARAVSDEVPRCDEYVTRARQPFDELAEMVN